MIVGILHQIIAISNNRTTNECLRSRLPNNIYDKGFKINWKEVCNV